MQLLDVGPDPGDDRPHGAPGDPHQLGDRALGALGGQPGDLLIEPGGVSGAMTGPGHRADRGPVLAAVDPRCVGLEMDLDGAQVQRPPPTTSLATVVPRRPSLTSSAASSRTSRGPNAGHQSLLVLVELDVLHDCLLDPQQGSP